MLRSGQHHSHRAIRSAIRLAILRNATLFNAASIGCARRRGIRRGSGKVCQGAVATPVFVWLRPPNPLCTPIVASRVATARLPIHR
jgi:hypothetical protein